MATPEPTSTGPKSNMTPLEYLAGADKEWADGNHLEAAGLLWKATKSTFIELAAERRLDYDEYLIDLAKALEAAGSVSEGYYRDNLVVGKLMRAHAEMDVLEGYELESTYKLARQFIVEQHSEPE